MSTQSLVQAQHYDRFEGPDLDATRWTSLPLPLPDGSVRLAVEPSAASVVQDGLFSVTVEEFQNAHASVQEADNAKHMLVSTNQFDLPLEGTATFSVRQAATRLGPRRPGDLMFALAAFNVIDVEQGLVFDVLSDGEHVLAVHEQLGHAPRPAGPAFTHVVLAPFAAVVVAPGVPNECAVEFDASVRTVRWLVDGAEIYRVAGGSWPTRVGFGLALMSGVRLRDGRSGSLQGQGLRASWSSPAVAVAG